VWNQYTLRCREPAPVRAALESAGIEWRHYYPRPVCCEPGLGALRRDAAEFPNAARACAEAVSVPVRGSCDPETIREIAAVVRAAAR
jgi:dTDP-4-amino-4,6-dideoxygalactose transaminase